MDPRALFFGRKLVDDVDQEDRGIGVPCELCYLYKQARKVILEGGKSTFLPAILPSLHLLLPRTIRLDHDVQHASLDDGED